MSATELDCTCWGDNRPIDCPLHGVSVMEAQANLRRERALAGDHWHVPAGGEAISELPPEASLVLRLDRTLSNLWKLGARPVLLLLRERDWPECRATVVVGADGKMGIAAAPPRRSYLSPATGESVPVGLLDNSRGVSYAVVAVGLDGMAFRWSFPA